MPQKSLKPCPHPGCIALVREGRCEKHKNVLQKEIDARRGSFSARGYTYRWGQYRATFIREHPLCGDCVNGKRSEHSACRREGRNVPATDVDHIVPHRGDEVLFWDPMNHQSLCARCHGVKTAGEVNARNALAKGVG